MEQVLPWLILAIPLLLMWNLGSRTRRQQRDIRAVQGDLAPGAEIMTGSGMYATVVTVDDERVVLETAPGQRSSWDRRAVVKVVTRSAEGLKDDDVTSADDSDATTP